MAVALRPATPPPRRARLSFRARRGVAAWLLALPWVALFAAFTIGPVLASLTMSLTDLRSTDVRNPLSVELVGLDNYTRLFDDETFRKAATNTLYFVVFCIPLTMVAALAVAIALDRGVDRLRTFFRVGYYLPVVTSIVAIAVVWRFLLHPEWGVINQLLDIVGIDGPNWLESTTWAMPAIIVMTAWRNMGFLMVIFLAGLQAIPRELYEVAEVDGATRWQRLRHVTLPMLRPIMLFGAVYTGIGYLQFFEEPFVMTQGGPLNSTLSVAMFTYNQFGFGNYAYASATAYVLFVAIVAMTALMFRTMRSRT